MGVSAGPDSVALLYILNGLSKELNIRLHIAHLDHMLRSDSCKDAVFVQKLAKKLDIPITCGLVDVARLSQTGSIEEIARNARLAFFFETAKQTKAKKIALGHNLDDQAETVLMRILRGTGLYGLSGMLPKKMIGRFWLVRPLIEIRRREIETYLKRKKISPRIDRTNLRDVYFRNRIRHDLIPFIEKNYSSNIKELLANMAEGVALDYDYLDLASKRSVRGCATRISLRKISRLHPALRRIAFRNAISCVKGDTRRITFTHIKEIEDLALNRPLASIVDLPKGVSVVKTKTHLSFASKLLMAH